MSPTIWIFFKDKIKIKKDLWGYKSISIYTVDKAIKHRLIDWRCSVQGFMRAMGKGKGWV